MPQNKTVLVIGATSEIATAITATLEKAEYVVRTASRQKEVSDYCVDLKDLASLTEFITDIGETKLDWIIYCAGVIEPGESFTSFDTEYGEESEVVNFTAPRVLATALLKNIATGGGVICLSSTAGIWGTPQFPMYATWKGALNTFLSSLMKSLKGEGKYAFAVCPGPTNTRMRQAVAGDADKHQDPLVIGGHILHVIKNPEKYMESPVLVMRESNLYTLKQDVELQIK